MDGEISANSEPDQGTEIKVVLPARTSNASPNQGLLNVSDTILKSDREMPANYPPSTLNQDKATKKQPEPPLVLIIEDNPDVIVYIRKCLESSYKIETAPNGHIGVEKALKIIPDVVISDVIMPKQNGLQVCKALKNDERTSHIPIILLTAKSEENAKIEGLESGADAYLNKPFNKKELLVRLQKLIALRRKLQAKYAAKVPPKSATDKEASPEDAFLLKVWRTVEPQIGEDTFGVPELSKAMAMSESQLHRKMKALTGKSTVHYIRSIRLQKGMELLKTTGLSVGQVAYRIGFTDPNYFSRTFSEKFGCSPRTVRKQNN
jgi:YesN/AraC family two-component response regulator